MRRLPALLWIIVILCLALLFGRAIERAMLAPYPTPSGDIGPDIIPTRSY